MAEGSYEYECMRAELLGADQPDFEAFTQRQQEADESRRLAAEAEDLEAANMQAADIQSETLQAAGGKLDELNTILSATQKRLDRFKVRCGSVTELIKTKIGGMSTSTGDVEEDKQEVGVEVTQQDEQSSVDKLDALLAKAQRAEVSLNSQNKQMRRFLK